MIDSRDIPITISASMTIGDPDTDAPAAPVFMTAVGGIRDTVGIARAHSTSDGLHLSVEITHTAAAAIDFGSAIAEHVSIDGGDHDGHELTGWRLADIEFSRRMITASVNSSGWDDMPLAGREVEWDGDAAAQRVAAACDIDGDSPDWGCYASAFLYQDDDADPETVGAYGMGIADEIDGQRVIVPRGVFAAAGVLQGAMGGIDAPEDQIEQMRGVLDGVYARMAVEFDDSSLVAPWSQDQDQSDDDQSES